MTRIRLALGATTAVVALLLGPGGSALASAGVTAVPPTVAVAAVGEWSASGAQPALNQDWRARMLTRVNAVRAAAGVRPLRLCPALERSAESYAGQLARRDRVSHTDVDGGDALDRVTTAGYRADLVGENLAAGQPSVAAVMRAWRGSPTHYATLTYPGFRHVGFGYEPGRGTYDTFWVQHFGVGGSCS